MICVKCKENNQSPGAEPYCGSCWAKDTSSTEDWPSYDETFVSMSLTGKRCKRCYRQLYAMPGDDTQADICVDCNQ